jgi:hypothetical protein
VLRHALTGRETPAAVRVRTALKVLKMAAAQPEGPTDPEDARGAVARRDLARRVTAL